MIRGLLVIILAFGFAGCAKTRVILLQDADGKVGSVEVATEGGTQLLKGENEYTDATSSGSKPKEAKVMSREKIAADYGQAMGILPEKPVSFLLYFKSGTSELTEQSFNLIPDVLASVVKREPCEISIIGHSDTMGAADYNIKLSLERANMIKDILVEKGVNMSKLEIRSHGENDPVIKTGDNVSEPKNRRVEVMVR